MLQISPPFFKAQLELAIVINHFATEVKIFSFSLAIGYLLVNSNKRKSLLLHFVLKISFSSSSRACHDSLVACCRVWELQEAKAKRNTKRKKKLSLNVSMIYGSLIKFMFMISLCLSPTHFCSLLCCCSHHVM
jgi:hypothetical protein